MKGWLFFKLAAQNLLRFRRRTLLVGVTLILCGGVLVFNDSLGNGIEAQLLRNLVFLQTGHLTLSPSADPAAAGDPGRWQRPPPALLDFLRHRRDLAFHPRLETAVMVQARGETITRAFLIGLDPVRESGSLSPLLPVRTGTPLQALKPGALLLSEEYARRLKIRPGDPVTLTVHTSAQGLRMMDFELGGIFRKAAPWQEFFIFAPLPAVQELLAVPDRIGSLRIILTEPQALDRIQRELTTFLKRQHPAWEVKNFRETGGFSLGIVQANRFSIVLMDALLLSVAGLGISLLILLSIQLRLPELRILSLLGTSPGWLRTLIVLEALLLGLTFGTAGVLLGTAIAQFLHHGGITVSSLPLTYLLGSNLLIPVVRWSGPLKALGLILGLGLVSAILPLWQSRRYGFLI
ncbi:MAG: FtsX-like permease family protein [Deltaproteobacteria bacterium]|nr:FtsX-like permease family protein [Deltaproteobacteria bacterium]